MRPSSVLYVPQPEEPVVGVDRELGAVVVDAGLRDVEVERGEALLDELHEPAGRTGADVIVERLVASAWP